MKKGFTLIELLLVITIMGVLAATSFAILNPTGKLKQARDTKRKSDLVQIQAALEFYRSDQGSYPTSIPSCGTPLTVAGTTYMKSVPCDPRNSGDHTYKYLPLNTPPTSYRIVSCLENTSDPQIDGSNNGFACSGGTINWSYTVTDP